MRRPTEIERGAVEAFGVVAIAALPGTYAATTVPAPSQELLEGIATIGVGLFIAFVVEMAWLATRVKNEKDHERRLGAFVGMGFAGLVGIVVALLLSAHRAAGHSNLLDDVGFSWVVVSLAVLGSVVAMQPLLVHEWSESQESD